MQRAHVVGAIGQFNQQHPDVLGHGQEKLAKILGLFGLIGLQFDPRQLGDAVDQTANAGSKFLVDIGARGVGVFDSIMQEGGDNGVHVQLHIGQDAGDFDRMREIRVARGTLLRAVHSHGVDIGAVKQRLVHARVVAAHTLNKFVLPDHGLSLPRRRRRGDPERPPSANAGQSTGASVSSSKPPAWRICMPIASASSSLNCAPEGPSSAAPRAS